MKTIKEQLAIAVAQKQQCLNGGPRQTHQRDYEDIFWLMGWADNAIEEQLIREKYCKNGHDLGKVGTYEHGNGRGYIIDICGQCERDRVSRHYRRKKRK